MEKADLMQIHYSILFSAANNTVSWTRVSRAAGKRIDWTPPGSQYHGKRKVEPNAHRV
jgi:hypothetical protein